MEMRKTFINFTNHRLDHWDDRQRQEAEKWGDLVELPFPQVSSLATEEEIAVMADQYVEKMLSLNPVAVLCQGEFNLAFAVVERLKKNHITVLAACSERKAEEYVDDNGQTVKTAYFSFVKFREF